MCVLYVSFGSKVRPRNFGCVAMHSAVLFIFRSRLLVYSAGSGVNRVHVVLSGFSVRLFCFGQAKTLCRYVCMIFLSCLVYVSVGFWDGDYVSQLPYVWHYVGVAVFNMLVRNASPRGPMCFRCLMFNLSGPCELLFLLCFIASWT